MKKTQTVHESYLFDVAVLLIYLHVDGCFLNAISFLYLPGSHKEWMLTLLLLVSHMMREVMTLPWSVKRTDLVVMIQSREEV